MNRFLLSLVVALSLATLASADSINPAAAFPHSGASVYSSNSTNGALFTPTKFVAYNSYTSTGENGNARIAALLPGKLMDDNGISAYKSERINFPVPKNGPTCCAVRQGIGTGLGHGLSTPEPGSLMLLSTGLMGIAGIMRRKLRRG